MASSGGSLAERVEGASCNGLGRIRGEPRDNPEELGSVGEISVWEARDRS